MPIDNVLAGIAVRDFDANVAWYQRLLGRSPDFRPMDEVAEWQFARGGSLQVFRDPERAGSSSVTFAVSDLAEEIAALEEQEVSLGETTTSEIVKTASVTDPSGNRIVFAEALAEGLAR